VSVVAIGVLSLPSLGMFLLPVALAACTLAATRNRFWPESACGVLAGTGIAGLLVGFLHLGYVPALRDRWNSALASRTRVGDSTHGPGWWPEGSYLEAALLRTSFSVAARGHKLLLRAMPPNQRMQLTAASFFQAR
jgi:hypothetical protein